MVLTWFQAALLFLPAVSALQPRHVLGSQMASRLRPRQDVAGCESLISLQSACGATELFYSDLDEAVDAASCICAPSSTFEPSIYDGYFQSCASAVSSASPEEFTLYGLDILPTAPCETYGTLLDFDGLSASAAATRTSSRDNEESSTLSITRGPAGPTPFDFDTDECSSVSRSNEICISATPDILSQPIASQEACICSIAGYNSLWNACMDSYFTGSPDELSSSLGFDVGDVSSLYDPCTSGAGATSTETGDGASETRLPPAPSRLRPTGSSPTDDLSVASPSETVPSEDAAGNLNTPSFFGAAVLGLVAAFM